ncbi:hypothetical protein IID19_03570 [Patescibacteria group bacterium]|nr:hypothetical protein [Patescibacteria group bacterium]
MEKQLPQVATEVKTKLATGTKIALGIMIVTGIGAVIAIVAGLFTA